MIKDSYVIKMGKIHNIVLRMEFSKDNFLDIFNYIDKSIKLTEEEGAGELNLFLGNSRHTKRDFLDMIKSNDIDKHLFDRLKFEFLADLALLPLNY